MPEFRLPKLADTLVEGTVTRWLKHEGEHVDAGEPLVEVETDKVNTELEAPVSGVLTEILADEGATVPVEEVLARIEQEDADAQPGQAAAAGTDRPGANAAPAPARAHADARATPAVVEPDPAAGAAAVPGLPALRLRIAERMQEARATISQGSATVELEAGDAPEGGWTAAFVRAAASAGGFGAVGVAVELEDGLVVPVVRHPADRSPTEVAADVRDLVARARDGTLRPEEVTGGEFTVTNVGSVGTLAAFPLVNPGQPAILATGSVTDGRLLLTLCYDRAELDERHADDLLAGIAERLQNQG
ncbi:MAG TPA: 2-oxo acid dehydrogenase subunit E2 [Candidatus Binatia bacterium]|jgi:2-oxoglutarate dehydrogenase E2 component (dihydrolipoamide succinyltransferase)|nr:2-oxo acid dehydrogenase subunit E2 [Candidatus Binatia bacterium]